MSLTARTARGSEPMPAVHAPVEQQPATEPTYELVDMDRYAVMQDGTVGYVEVVPPVFVCYVGHPYPKAEEVAQRYDFHEAVQTVLEQAAPSRHLRPAR